MKLILIEAGPDIWNVKQKLSWHQSLFSGEDSTTYTGKGWENITEFSRRGLRGSYTPKSFFNRKQALEAIESLKIARKVSKPKNLARKRIEEVEI